MVGNSLRWAGLALAASALATGAFVQMRIGQPRPPDQELWQLVPVASHDIAPDLLAEARRPESPGVLLHRHLQIVPRGVEDIRSGAITFSAVLGEGASLHAFFGASVDGRHGVHGPSLFLAQAAVPELFHVVGKAMDRRSCAFKPPLPTGEAADVTIKLRGSTAEMVVRSAQGTSRATCPVTAGGKQMGFRAGQAAVVLDAVRVKDAEGRLLFKQHSAAGPARRLVVAALTLVLLLLAWLADGRLSAWLLGRGWRAGLVFSAWTSLPLVTLPLLPLLDLGALAHGLRLGRTSTSALGLGLVLVLWALVRAVALLLRSRRLRCRERLPRARLPLARIFKQRLALMWVGAAGAHAVLLAALVLLSGRGCLAAAGLEAASALDAAATLVAALALPLASWTMLRWLAPGHAQRLLAAEALSWAPSLLAAALALALLAAGAVETWNTAAHLLAAVAASLTFKLILLQVNARATRHVNWASLACVLLLALAAEGTARQTYLDVAWSGAPAGRLRAHDTLGWSRAGKEFDHILNTQRHSSYPEEFFPVAFSPRSKEGATRIVCMGGSSTGGAFQMDSLDTFFPADLQRLLDSAAGPGRYEVLNQGVGGWNTFHIRLYLEQFVDRLRPDILILYVGHNDIMTTGALTYREHWTRYRRQHSSLKGVMEVLDRSRLVVGYKSLLEAIRAGPAGRRGTVSHVPVKDARENFERIFALAQKHDAKVVLASEAINTRAPTLVAYRQMQAEVARVHGQHYLDANGALWKLRQEDLFLDRNHLTHRGHKRVAKLLRSFLEERGLVPK